MKLESASETSTLRSSEVEAGGFTFKLAEPDWRYARRAVMHFLALIGNREDLNEKIKRLFEVAQKSQDEDTTKEAQIESAVEIVFDDADLVDMDPEAVAELLGIVTDKDADWFLEPGRLTDKDMLLLLTGVASVLPFGSVLAQRGSMTMAFVGSWTESFDGSPDTSESDADGEPGMLKSLESDGATPSAPTSASGKPSTSRSAH